MCLLGGNCTPADESVSWQVCCAVLTVFEAELSVLRVIALASRRFCHSLQMFKGSAHK
jgi:hypothetical protein